jgi:hypothetical protein
MRSTTSSSQAIGAIEKNAAISGPMQPTQHIHTQGGPEFDMDDPLALI